MKLNKKYLYLSIFFFLVELYIGLYVRDSFIRPYFGDYLVVILLYCMVRTVWHGTPWKAAIGVLLFSYLIETLQYFNIVEVLGLGHSEFARVIIGTSFAWHDMIAYTLGIATVFWAMKYEKVY